MYSVLWLNVAKEFTLFCWIKSKEDSNQCLVKEEELVKNKEFDNSLLLLSFFFCCFCWSSFVMGLLYIKEVELTEEEEAIKANLMDAQPLPPEILDNIVPVWWKKEPFR